ncbi:MAG: hypothetical protein ABI539_05190 [Acidobacteriota bacterium]
MANSIGGLSRRMLAFIGLIIVGIVIGVLIYAQQISILYVLATLSLVVLLLVVAFADLENVGRNDMDNGLSRD